jgi:DNA-binding NarL/FixJ family response regulator
MIVDDHNVVRRGVRALIESVDGWEVCAEASDGHEALSVAEKAQPDIIVLDVSMPTLGGLDATSQLRKLLPNVEILILTMHESDQLVGQAFRAGARGYLLKSESDDRLMDALDALWRHKPYFSPSVSETLLQGYLSFEPPSDPKHLTPRERQIVKLVAEGNTNKRIALILNVSIKTVETHRSAAMRKLGAKSSADLTLYAARNNLVEL